jgi:hypothetical protein
MKLTAIFRRFDMLQMSWYRLHPLSTQALDVCLDLVLQSTCQYSLLPCFISRVQVTDFLSRNGIPWEEVNGGCLTIKMMDVRNKELDIRDGE